MVAAAVRELLAGLEAAVDLRHPLVRTVALDAFHRPEIHRWLALDHGAVLERLRLDDFRPRRRALCQLDLRLNLRRHRRRPLIGVERLLYAIEDSALGESVLRIWQVQLFGQHVAVAVKLRFPPRKRFTPAIPQAGLEDRFQCPAREISLLLQLLHLAGQGMSLPAKLRRRGQRVQLNEFPNRGVLVIALGLVLLQRLLVLDHRVLGLRAAEFSLAAQTLLEKCPPLLRQRLADVLLEGTKGRFLFVRRLEGLVDVGKPLLRLLALHRPALDGDFLRRRGRRYSWNFGRSLWSSRSRSGFRAGSGSRGRRNIVGRAPCEMAARRVDVWNLVAISKKGYIGAIIADRLDKRFPLRVVLGRADDHGRRLIASS